jgi:hypothetical protein
MCTINNNGGSSFIQKHLFNFSSQSLFANIVVIYIVFVTRRMGMLCKIVMSFLKTKIPMSKKVLMHKV